MRSLFQAISADVGNTRMFAINVYDEFGAHADQMILPQVNDEIIAEGVRELMRVHRFETVDLETDDEALFKVFIAEAGVNVRYVDSDTLSTLYRQLAPNSPVYPILVDLYGIETEAKPEQEPEKVEAPRLPWYRRLLNFIKGVLRID